MQLCRVGLVRNMMCLCFTHTSSYVMVQPNFEQKWNSLTVNVSLTAIWLINMELLEISTPKSACPPIP